MERALSGVCVITKDGDIIYGPREIGDCAHWAISCGYAFWTDDGKGYRVAEMKPGFRFVFVFPYCFLGLPE